MVGENLLCEWPVVSFSPSQLLSPLLASEGWQSVGCEIIRGQDRVLLGLWLGGALSGASYLKLRLSLVLPSCALQRPPVAPCGHSPCDVGGVFLSL